MHSKDSYRTSVRSGSNVHLTLQLRAMMDISQTPILVTTAFFLFNMELDMYKELSDKTQ